MRRKNLFLFLFFLIVLPTFTFTYLNYTSKIPQEEPDDQKNPVVASVSLIDADTDQPLPGFDPFENGTQLNMTAQFTSNLNIRANTEPPEVGSIQFNLDNTTIRIENSPPYSLAGDTPQGEEYHPWTPSLGWHKLTVTPFTDPDGGGSQGKPYTIQFSVVKGPNKETPDGPNNKNNGTDELGLMPGQITFDPENPAWLSYHQSGPFFMCGPGDPENFLYRGALNEDGTRNGDQMELIEKLKGTGANCIYIMAVRSHGGDGDSTQNPFIDNNPLKGLNPVVLEQWETWFTELDENGIAIFLFIYDDSSVLWDTGDLVGTEEKAFIQDIVNQFEHHKNLIWVVNEEYGHAYTEPRISNIAAEIRAADNFSHPIAVHHHSHAPMGFPEDPNIDQYAMQWYSVYTREELHELVVNAWMEADGRYNLRKKSWAVAMAGSYVMILGMDIENTPLSDLQDCGRLVDFLESTNFYEMAPHDEFAYGGTEYVLAKPGESYIAYASSLKGDIGLRGLPKGEYGLKWFDAVTGKTVVQEGVKVYGGNQTWIKPGEIGEELAVYINRTGEVSSWRVFPSEKWEHSTPEEQGLESSKLDEIASILGGDGCIIKNGYIVKTWGSQTETHDWFSSSKPVISTMLLFAVEEGKLNSVDDPIRDWGWDLIEKDYYMTFRHLANMMSGYSRPEKPGEAYAYNDPAIQLYFLTLERVYKQSLNDAAMTRLHEPLQLEGKRVFNSKGRVVMSVQDFGRICWFWLNNGYWNGQQLLAEEYFDVYMRAGVPIDLPFAPYDGYSNDYVNIGTYGSEKTSRDSPVGPGIYGFNWWFNTPGLMSNGTYFDRRWAEAPPDTIMTRGYDGHDCIIIPSLDIVLVNGKGNLRTVVNEIMKLIQ
jgi:hypothetical protein